MKIHQSLVLGLLATVDAISPIADGAGSDQPNVPVVKVPGISIDLVEAGSLPAGPIDMARTYAKYRKPAPAPVLKAAAAATQSGTVQASNEPYDKAYLAPVKVHGEKFMLDFDTGSSDLWVFSTLQPSSQTAGHVLYKEQGTKASGETWDISYGDGSGASGVVYGDTCTVGAVTATVQAIEAATSVSSTFVTDKSDGLLGLGFDAGNTCTPYQCYTFMHQVGPTLPQDLFTATLRKGKPGTYNFGYIDSSMYTGAISYSNVNHAGSGNPAYWEFIAGGYSIGSGAKVTGNIDAIADTGTSLAYLPQALVTAYYNKISGASYSSTQGGYVLPCNAKPPTLSIYSGGGKHTMPGSYAIYAPISSTMCFGGVQANTGIGFSILGDVFLKSQFVVFDIANNRVGFAQQA